MAGSLWERLQQKKFSEEGTNEETLQKELEEDVKESKSDKEDILSKKESSKEKDKSSLEKEEKEEVKTEKKKEEKKEKKKEEKTDSSLSRTTMKKATFLKIKNSIQNVLIDDYPLEVLKDNADKPAFKKEVNDRISELIDAQNLPLTKEEKQNLSKVLLDDALGFGPIQPLINDPTISEIMVNHENQIYVERNGKLILTDIFFDDDKQVLHIADKILSPLNRRVDESNPYVDARLQDGSRVNIIIPPLAVKGPCITIRKFEADPFTVDDLIGFGTMTPEMANFIEACVKARLNIVVSGGTGSGKTTTLNVLSSFIPSDERIVTIEDAAELQLRQPHVVTLESKPPSMSGTGAVAIRDLVKNSLRMRPDRVIVGECRSGEALDMLQAMNTGHDGSMTTGHANSPRDMLARLETMVLMAGMDLPIKAIREQIASAVDVIVQQSRLKDGTRRVTHITEVQKMEGDVIVMQDLFVFKQTGFTEEGKIIGKMESTGIRPSFMSLFEAYGIELPNDLFYKK